MQTRDKTASTFVSVIVMTRAIGQFAVRHRLAIAFVCVACCLAGIYAALRMPSSVFPQTDFPRVVILVDNGVMPADEMMATIVRPIEEGMKDIPGAKTVRSTIGRGSAEISVFFDWHVDMVKSELHVHSRIAQIRPTLPATATTVIWRLTFSAFPILGVSLTSPKRDVTELWETARYHLKPRFLRIPGVARVDIVGGRAPEYRVTVDPIKLQACGLSLQQVVDSLTKNNLVAPTGMHEEDHTMFLSVVDGRLRSPTEIEDFPIATTGTRAVRVRDFARVVRSPEPVFNVVTADGVPAVLLNIRSQPDGSTLEIANAMKTVLAEARHDLPPDMRLVYFYDQSLFVRESAKGVRDAIGFGLLLSVVILFLFLKDWGSTATAVVVIPVTLLVTVGVMRLCGMSFNLMTLGGIAAAIGLVIDDAIVVVEAIHAKLASGTDRVDAIQEAIASIVRPLAGSTLTPVVVFVPLAFLEGITGVFFRALALTMTVALLTSLALALTLTPSIAAWVMRSRKGRAIEAAPRVPENGRLFAAVLRIYEKAVRFALGHRWATVALCLLALCGGSGVYRRLETEFLPPLDEGGFVIDYVAPSGTSLAETDRQLLLAESILRANPDVESYSRRTGAALGFEVVEPNTGDFLVKLKPGRKHPTQEVISTLRDEFNKTLPDVEWEFPGILGDLIGDLTWSPMPIEVKLFSTDLEFLKKKAPEIENRLKTIRGVVDTKDGLIYAGPTLTLRPRPRDMQRLGLNSSDVAAAVNTAMIGQVASSVLEGDRVINIRVAVDHDAIANVARLRDLPLRTPDGDLVKLSQLADIEQSPGQLELHREDLRQNVMVTGRLEGRDLGSAMREIEEVLGKDPSIPPGTIEFGGLYEQQRESFRNLLLVLVMAIFLVFTVLVVEFRSFFEPLVIVFGSILALVGTVLGLWLTGTSLNVVSFLGAVIGVGIVAKNGILMLDMVDHLRESGLGLGEALVRSGQRRLRPVLMTSMAAAFGMLPLACGVGGGADMLRPLAIAVVGALAMSVLLALVAMPAVYAALLQLCRGERP